MAFKMKAGKEGPMYKNFGIGKKSPMKQDIQLEDVKEQARNLKSNVGDTINPSRKVRSEAELAQAKDRFKNLKSKTEDLKYKTADLERMKTSKKPYMDTHKSPMKQKTYEGGDQGERWEGEDEYKKKQNMDHRARHRKAMADFGDDFEWKRDGTKLTSRMKDLEREGYGHDQQLGEFKEKWESGEAGWPFGKNKNQQVAKAGPTKESPMNQGMKTRRTHPDERPREYPPLDPDKVLKDKKGKKNSRNIPEGHKKKEDWKKPKMKSKSPMNQRFDVAAEEWRRSGVRKNLTPGGVVEKQQKKAKKKKELFGNIAKGASQAVKG